MIATLAADCLSLTIDQSFVLTDFYSGNRNNLVCDYILDVDYNCCNSRSLPLRALHTFVSSIVGCGQETIAAVDYGYIDFTITSSLTKDCVATFSYQNFSNSALLTPVVSPTTFNFRFYFPIATTATTCAVTFLTHNELTYSLSIDLSSITIPGPCNTSAVLVDTITYPIVPVNYGITLDAGSNSIITTSVTFGQTADPTYARLLPGIYCFTMKGVNHLGVPLVTGGANGTQLYSQSSVLFVDCDSQVKCAVTALAATCDLIEPLLIYEALLYNNTCQVLTCTDACNMYKKLMDYLNNNCSSPIKPCNCNG